MTASTERAGHNTLQWVLKLVIFGFVSAAVADLLKTHAPVQNRMAELIGLLSGVLIQQIIPPRLTLGRFVSVLFGVCAVMGSLILLHL